MRILTNMAFWQSSIWTKATDSIIRASTPPNVFPAPTVQALRLFVRRHRYDVVVTMGARESLAYGLLCALTGQKSKQLMCEVFFDEASPSNPLWRLKTGLYRWIAKRSLGVLTNSSAETQSTVDRLGIAPDRVRYVPMHTNITHPELCEESDGYILSAGFTLRDYPCLLRAAPSIGAPITIICSKKERLPRSLPANVTVVRHVNQSEYLQYLRRCFAVALPLKPSARSTGQVVMLEAMAMGKPVVATGVMGVLDYIRHGENGLLCEPCDEESLAEQINRLLKDREMAKRLGRQALEDVLDENTIETHAARKLEAIGELVAGY